MADHALERGEAPAQAAFYLIDPVMDLGYGERRIDMAMEIDHLAGRSAAYTDVVHVVQDAIACGDFGERPLDLVRALGRCVDAGEVIDLQRLDMGVDLDLGA